MVNEKEIWDYLIKNGLTKAGAAGLMGNLQAESGGASNKLERLCAIRLQENGKGVWTDESYTAAVDSGKIGRAEFLNPLPGKQYGYGLVQWTTPARKAGLYDLVKSRKVSIGHLQTQLEYMLSELKSKFPSVLSVLTSTSDLNAASDIVLQKFESPADWQNMKATRASYGKAIYDRQKGGSTTMTQEQAVQMLIATATKYLGYSEGKNNSNQFSTYLGHPAEAWCFPAGTLIATPGGLKPIEELSVNDEVYSGEGGTVQKITNVKKRLTGTIELSIKGTLPIVTTPEHPFLTEKGFVSAGDLTAEDYVLVTQLNPDNKHGEKYAWLLGYYIGNGSKSVSREQYFLCFPESKSVTVRKKAEVCGIQLTQEKRKYESRTCLQDAVPKYTTASNTEFCNILSQCGDYAIEKEIPLRVFGWCHEAKIEFLEGLFYADGDTSSGKQRLSTSSNKLVVGLTILAATIGQGLSVTKQASVPHKYFDKRYNRTRTIKRNRDNYLVSFAKLTDTKGRNLSHYKVINGNVHMRVKGIDSNAPQIVYNLTVSDTHTYSANGICVHNCDDFADAIYAMTFTRSVANVLLYGGCGEPYTPTSAQYFKNAGKWTTTNPQAGDQIFFKNDTRICHTGIVTKVDASTVYTIEGNTSPMNGVDPNGGGVYAKQYARNNTRIAGYGHPKWEAIASIPAPAPAIPTQPQTPVQSVGGNVEVNVPSLIKGNVGESVKTLQVLLNARGNKLSVDGEFGSATEKAVADFQTKHGVPVVTKGTVGVKTWTALCNNRY